MWGIAPRPKAPQLAAGDVYYRSTPSTGTPAYGTAPHLWRCLIGSLGTALQPNPLIRGNIENIIASLLRSQSGKPILLFVFLSKNYRAVWGPAMVLFVKE